ncbi:hypothetical protein VTJ04DRAFT_6575 [Mycothermus thermophilus]|uniref:uncharacterized protein n=1 Tax=Humicola insolens TaxID=85995 RepID=UPI0037443A77
MTSQQQAIMETVLALRRTLKRSAYDSDSDSSIEQTTNRGNKLKKRARFVHQGRLSSAAGHIAYKEMAEHAGYHRPIIHRNPPLIDEDGYDIDSEYDDDEQVQEAIAAAVESNPYSSIHIEQLLAPLTSVTDLPTHPTLSRPFTSTALTELVQQAITLMHKENKALWKAKPLLTKLMGDNTWAPCGLMAAPDDEDAKLFSDTVSFFNRPRVRPAGTVPTTNGTTDTDKTAETKQPAAEAGPDGQEAQTSQAADGAEQDKKSETKTQDDETLPDADGPVVNGNSEESKTNDKTQPQGDGNQASGEPSQEKPEPANAESNNATKDDVEMAEAPAPDANNSATTKPTDGPSAGDAPNPTPPPGPPSTTTAAAATVAAISSTFDPPTAEEDAALIDELFIHPLFHLPPQAHPDRDLGLPEQEAEEVRRLLLLYVQKQEEICRGAQRLAQGLLRADRLRKTVLSWAKAEAHCGPNRDMSDGEDWYDREEWGLTEDLKKGEDEVEEESQTTQKKTRNRK